MPRARLLTLIVLVLAAVAVGCDSDPTARDQRPNVASRDASEPLRDEDRADCPESRRPMTIAKRQGPCWRPYADTSPFNRPLPSSPRVDGDSDAIVDRLLGFGEIQNLVAGTAGETQDYGRPTYFSRPSDPTYTIACVREWGRCALEGTKLKIPAAARAASGTDGHMTVVDQQSGWEYSFWQVMSKPPGGGKLTISWGGRTRLDGDGLGSPATAAHFGNLAGLIRAEELEAGRIDHALLMVVSCDSGEFVFPAVQSGRPCTSIGRGNESAPAMGQRFQLMMSDAEIDALEVPRWKRAILRAMARYGMYVGDTGSGSWSLKEESGLTYTSFGRPDRWAALARRSGARVGEGRGERVLDLESDVDWQSRLRALDPCEADGSCG